MLRYFLLPSVIIFSVSLPSFFMATQTRSHTVCSFDNADIAALRTSDAFPDGAIIRPFDRSLRPGVSSDEWICFPAYLFSLGLRYLFLSLSCISLVPQALVSLRPCPWSGGCWWYSDIPIAYRLRSHGSSRFLLFSTSNNRLILKVTKNENEWKRNFFFVRRDSIAEGDSLPVKRFTTNPAKIPEVFDLQELDSYSSPALVKKEPTPKPSTASKPPVSSKLAVMPKPSPAKKPRASGSRKRKETDSPATFTEAFPYENHGFLESSGFMTSFLNQENILIFEDAGYDAEKAEITIVDQGKITAAKSQHYEDKFKAVTQEAQAAVKNATQHA
ncbi:hypothetical protein Hanom_Chr04g00346211 [Helianthus anomalus]